MAIKREILFNKKKGNYTFEKEIEGVLSEKRSPIRFKQDDSTAKYRRDILEKEILDN